MYENLGIENPSFYQNDIFAHFDKAISDIQNGVKPQNLIVQAGPGSGKTTVITAACNLIPKDMSAIVTAFGKKIASELKDRVPEHVGAVTLNSLGNRIWSEYVYKKYSCKLVVDGKKFDKIFSKLVPSKYNFLFSDVKFLVSQAKANGVVPNGYTDAFCANGVTDTNEFWFNLIRYFDRQIEDKSENGVEDIEMMAIDFARKILMYSLDDEKTIDFDDQLYMPVVKRTSYGTLIPCKKYNVVMVDETQDLNPIKRVLVARVLDNNGFFVAIGDKNQAIMTFTGADIESMDKIKTEFNCKVLPLSISYRCAKKIVDHVNEVINCVQASPTAVEGEINYLTGYKGNQFQPTDMVLCRNNAPLISFAYKLIRDKVKCKVLGRDIGAGLISLIDKLKHKNDPQTLISKLNDWKSQQISIIVTKNPFDNEEDIQRIKDKYDSIMLFIEESQHNTVDGIKQDINDMFSESEYVQNGFIVLSTAHKSKGLESDRVWILDKDLFYPKWVKKGTWRWTSEDNLNFVARSRCRFVLNYINSEDYGKDNK